MSHILRTGVVLFDNSMKIVKAFGHHNFLKIHLDCKACVSFPGFLLPPSLSFLLPLFSLSVCISYSSASWREHSTHTEMMKGLKGDRGGRKQEKADRAKQA